MALILTRALTLLSLFAIGAAACGDDKGDETTALTIGATTGATTGSTSGDGASETGGGSAPITSSDPTMPTTGVPETSDPTVPTQATEPGTTGDATTSMTGADDGPLCVNMGGYEGVKALIGDFVGRVLVDERINAYFLTTDLDAGRFVGCLEEQVGSAVGCAGVVYTCMDMKAVHAGMGISTSDFNDLAEDFSQAMDAHAANIADFTVEDREVILAVLGSMAPDIIEDVDANATTYQLVGRKPGLNVVIGGIEDPDTFLGRVASDITLVGFFQASNLPRLKTCLVRQVTTATGGPNIYGKEVTAPDPADPGVTTDDPCRDMKSVHADLKDPGDMLGIQFEDFAALVGHLQQTMDIFGVGMTEQNAILGALGPMCSDIVTVDPEMCG